MEMVKQAQARKSPSPSSPGGGLEARVALARAEFLPPRQNIGLDPAPSELLLNPGGLGLARGGGLGLPLWVDCGRALSPGQATFGSGRVLGPERAILRARPSNLVCT